jgi:hypothetical protein
MGTFSWIAQDTKRSCLIQAYTDKPCGYYLWDNRGNCWKEDDYAGDGVFQGKDYFVLLAEMNGWVQAGWHESQVRDWAILHEASALYYPNISEGAAWTWRNEMPLPCPHQGLLQDDD